MHEVQLRGQLISRHETPSSVEDALALLDRHGPAARPVAGGTDLLLELARGARPGVEVLVDLSNIPGLDRIEITPDGLRLGPLVTHNQVIASPVAVEHALPLAQACLELGSPALRNRATIAGNLVTASPANDTISALRALDATVELRSIDAQRRVPVADLFSGVRRTVIEPGELLVAIDVPRLAPGERGLFVKLGQRRAQAISVVHLAVVVGFDGVEVTHARIALGSVAPTIVRAGEAEASLVGRPLDGATIGEAAALAAASVEPIDDVRGSAAYRREQVAVMLRRALEALRDGRERECWPSFSVSLGPRDPRGEMRSAGPSSPGNEHRIPVPVARASIEGDERGHERGDESRDGSSVVRATVNGRPVEAAGAVGHTLLDWLRDEIGLTGTKEGCAEGECGACTVHLDGAAVLACLVPAPSAVGREITTIEGLAPDEGLHPLQKAFVDQFAVQCGFCIPGFVMAADRLVAECRAPTRGQIAQGLSGNLCRCTGYYRFYDAVEQVVAIQGADG